MVKAAGVVAAAAAAAVAEGTSGSVLMAGCNSMKLDEESRFAIDADVMPMSQVSGTSVFYSISDAEECRAKCTENKDCEYFTFRESKATGERVCILRPTPSLATSPLFQVRLFDDSSLFKYTSGPATDAAACDDGRELVTGCGGSAPGSCALLGKHVSFNATCLSDPAMANHCGVQGFACCVDCDAAGDGACCGRDSRLEGYLLKDGTSLGGFPSSVRNSEACWAQCYGTPGCTHWNYITTEATGGLQGGCYLRSYEQVNQPGFVKAPAFVRSVVGGVDCSTDYGLVAPPPEPSTSELPSGMSTRPGDTTTPTAAPATGMGGQPIPGSCFESGVDVVGASIYQQWGIPVGEACQAECQKWSGCVGFVYDPAHTGCYLKYSFDSKVLATQDVDVSWRFVTGPRDCPGVAPAPRPENEAACIFADWDIQLEDLTATPAGSVYECWQKCSFWEGCNGWSFFADQCYLKASVEPRVAAKGVVSGSKACSWPISSRRRFLMPESVVHLKEERLGDLAAFSPTIPPAKHSAHETERTAQQQPKPWMVKPETEGKLETRGAADNSSYGKEEGAVAAAATDSVIAEEAATENAVTDEESAVSAHHVGTGGTVAGSSPTKSTAAPHTRTAHEAEAEVETEPEGPRPCVRKNTDIRGPALETTGNVTSGVACQKMCLARDDCFYASYTAAEQLCKIRFEGPLFDKLGTDVYARQCDVEVGGNMEAAEESEEGQAEALVGHSYHFLGSPSDWSVKGDVPDFSAASKWSRMALLVMTGEEKDCFISDVLVNVESCWDRQEAYLPLDVQLQVVGVARGASFPGWDAIPWQSSGRDTSKDNGLLELFNERVKITAEGDTIEGGHGVWISEITNELTAGWPEDMTAPVNFRQGSFYARLRAFGERAVPARLVFCITASDQPLSEICSFPLVVPSTTNTTGDGENA